MVGPKLSDLSLAVTIHPTTRQPYCLVEPFTTFFDPSIFPAFLIAGSLRLSSLFRASPRHCPVNFCTNIPIFSLVLPTNSLDFHQFKTNHKAIMPPAKKESKEKNTHKLALKGASQNIYTSLIPD